MDIKQLAAGYARAAKNAQSVTPKTSADPSAAARPNSLQVALSAASHTLCNAATDVDVTRVHAIRQALADGTLVINPERIAQGLIDSAQDIF